MRENPDLRPDKRSISMQILYQVACVKDYTQTSETCSFFFELGRKRKLVVKINSALGHKLTDFMWISVENSLMRYRGSRRANYSFFQNIVVYRCN